MNIYDVTVSREDELWVADIAGMTAATDVLRFSDLDVEVRDLIAGLTDAAADEFEIRWHHRAGDDDVTALISELAEVEAAADTATARPDAVRLEIIGRLSAVGLSSASSPTCSACPTSGCTNSPTHPDRSRDRPTP